MLLNFNLLLLTYTSLLGSKSFLFLHYFRITTRCNKQNCGYDACGQLFSLSHDSHLQKHYFVKYKVGFNKFVAIVNSTILKFICYELWQCTQLIDVILDNKGCVNLLNRRYVINNSHQYNHRIKICNHWHQYNYHIMLYLYIFYCTVSSKTMIYYIWVILNWNCTNR